MWISTLQAVGLIDIAKLLITRDSVKMVVYVKNNILRRFQLHQSIIKCRFRF
ncbi:MAG: hypothetical protein IPH32_07740 [Bacteroidetes bacterium]|nr:hypothetical protein [Bacteroidota bacterium]